MIEREEVRSIVQEVLEEEHLHNFTKIFEKEHNLFRGSHDNMPVPPSITENYYTQTEIEGMTHWRKDDDDIYYDDGYIGAGVLTEGSVLFVGADGKIIQDNAKAYWHNASKQLNIGDYDISGFDDLEDNFEADSIGATWTTHNTDANRTIDVDTPNTLTITTAASTDGRWVSALNEAPKLYKAVPAPPFEFVAKLPAYSMPTDNVEYGIFIGHYDADQTNQKFAYKFEKMRAGDSSKYIQVNRPHGQGGLEVGSDVYSVMDEDAALWFKIAVDEDEAVTFYVSDDEGVNWTQMQKGSVDYEWTGFFDSGMEIGFFLAGNVAAETVATFSGTTIEVLDHNAIIAERFKLTDSDLSHLLKLKWNEDDSVDRVLNLKVRGGNRTLDLYENLTIGNGYDVTITALGQANTFTMNEGFTIGNGHSGTLTFSAASKILTVEGTSVINQDLTTDATGVQFVNLLLTGYCKIDSSTTAIFIADAHDADAYLELKEDNVVKWTAGFDYTDSLKFKISEGVPGTNTRMEIISGGSMNVFDTSAGHIQITAQASGTARFIADSYTADSYVEFQQGNVLKWCSGYDFTDGSYAISEGAPGTNNRLKIASGGAVVIGGTLSIGEITVIDGSGINLQEDITFTGATTENLIKIPDDLPVALDITEADNPYIRFITTNGGEAISILQDVIADRWTGTNDNLFLGVGVGEDGNLNHTTGNTGYHNIAIGYQTLKAITTGYRNVAIGSTALTALTTGYYNVAVGMAALSYNIGGYYNMAIGGDACLNNTSGIHNMAIGKGALLVNSLGHYNVAIGTSALYSNTGSSNVAIGYQSANVKGAGDNNVLLGHQSGFGGTGAAYIGNVCIGYRSGYALTSGRDNVFLGFESGRHVSTGSTNVCIGYQAGETNLTTGSNQLWIENSNSAVPLIYGEFDNNLVRIHGKLWIEESAGGDQLSLEENGTNSIINTDTNPLLIKTTGTTALTISTSQVCTFAGNLIIPDAGYIGSVSDTDAIQIEADGDIVLSQDLAITGTLDVTGFFTNTGGAKLEIQNSVDGTSAAGIFMWDTTNTDWGIYMGQAGAGKSLGDGAACTNFAGDTTHHLRSRAVDAAGHGFIWENSSEDCLMDLESGTGNLSILGSVGIGTSPTYQLETLDTTVSSTRGICINQREASASGAIMRFQKAQGIGTAVANGDYVGSFVGTVHDGTAYRDTCGWGMRVNGTVGTNDIPTDLYFFAHNAHTISPIADGLVRLYITSLGNIGFGGQLTFGTNATKTLALSTGVAPTTSPADAFQMYSADIGGVADKAGVYFRDEAGNVISLGTGGMIMTGTARVYDGMEIHAMEFKAPAAGYATQVNRGMGVAWEFADGNEESINTQMRIPSKWVDTEDLTVILIWDSPATSVNCDWEVRYLFRAANEDMTTVTPEGTTQAYKTSSGTANGLVHSTFTIPTAAFDSGDKILKLDIHRDGNDGSDTLGAAAYLHALAVRGIADRLGGATT